MAFALLDMRLKVAHLGVFSFADELLVASKIVKKDFF